MMSKQSMSQFMKTHSTPNEPAGSEDRRSFIKKAATVAATVTSTNIFKTPVYGQNQAPSPGRVIGANDRIHVAYVGVGGQGMAHVRSQKNDAKDNNIVQTAVCDLYQKRLHTARDYMGLKESDAYGDHRKMLERKDIDAVTVATVDNWHAQVAIDAMNAGKHVYGEKPLARYMMEGFEIHDTVRRTGKVFQVGSQFCADPMFHKAAEWIRDGKLGPLVWAQGSYTRNNYPKSEWTYPVDPDANEQNLDWKRWLGNAPKLPFTPEHFFSWHKFYAYNSGILGNLLPHKFLPLMLATGNPEFPTRVSCTGTRKISTDRETTDTTHLLSEFPSGLTFLVAGSIVNEQGLPDMIRGLHASIYLASGQNRVQLKPERAFSEELEPEEFESPLAVASLARLEKNWFDCIRTGDTPLANIDLAIKSHVVLCMAEMAERLSLTLLFNEKTRKLSTGDGRPVDPISYDSVVPMTA
jgi:predicted dehydrogenase